MQKRPLKFSPVSGGKLSSVWRANEYRAYTGPSGVWLFNPWTGEERHRQKVADDPLGLLISDGELPPVPRAKETAAREALHDAAEREPVHINKPTSYVTTNLNGPQPGPADHPLQAVFALAIEQATRGKGVRHGGEATPFLEQPWAHYSKMHGRGFLTGQAAKKLEEAASTREGDAFVTEALGALVYIGMAILKEKGKV